MGGEACVLTAAKRAVDATQTPQADNTPQLGVQEVLAHARLPNQFQQYAIPVVLRLGDL